jgi:hypothetical protein
MLGCSETLSLTARVGVYYSFTVSQSLNVLSNHSSGTDSCHPEYPRDVYKFINKHFCFIYKNKNDKLL